jgi:hypothetical protein
MSISSEVGWRVPQVPPLRFAPVGMTILSLVATLHCVAESRPESIQIWERASLPESLL